MDPTEAGGAQVDDELDNADEEATDPRLELTDDMALLVGRLTSPDISGDDADTNPRIIPATEDDMGPSVIVSPPARMVGELSTSTDALFEPVRSVYDPALNETPRDDGVDMDGATALDDDFEDHSMDDDELGDDESIDVDESMHVDIDAEMEEALKSDRSPAPTPPPPPPDASKKRPPPPPARSRVPKPRPWWETFFSEDYLLTYSPPTDEQIARQCDFFWDSLGLEPGQTVLDVGCGLGLHAVELTRRGCLVVGIDLSLPMITRAAELAQESNLRINFLHTDIREISFEGTFDAALCVGTTFGFFDDADNADVLRRIYGALKPGGKLLLDVVNRDYVLSSQPNLIWFQGDGCLCMEETDFNYFTSQLILKRTLMKEDGEQSEVDYSLRLYSLHELGQLMRSTGFRVHEVSGHEATRGVFFGCHSMRMIMLGARAEIDHEVPTPSGSPPPPPPTNSNPPSN